MYRISAAPHKASAAIRPWVRAISRAGVRRGIYPSTAAPSAYALPLTGAVSPLAVSLGTMYSSKEPPSTSEVMSSAFSAGL